MRNGNRTARWKKAGETGIEFLLTPFFSTKMMHICIIAPLKGAIKFSDTAMPYEIAF